MTQLAPFAFLIVCLITAFPYQAGRAFSALGVLCIVLLVKKMF
jgi:hypothetical protein